MRKIKVEIKGLRPYMQHRRPSSEEEVKESKKITQILQKNSFDKDAAKKEAEFAVYRDDEGYFIPAEQMQESMASAGSWFKVPGSPGGKATYKKIIKSTTFPNIDSDKIRLETDDYEIDGRYVKIQKAGIMRYRPIFKDWSASFELSITDDTLNLDTLREILDKAGQEIGIGDYRPKYGLFEVTDWQLVK